MKQIERIFHQVILPSISEPNNQAIHATCHDFEILLYVISDRCPSGNSQTVLGRNLNHDLQHQTYHEMLYKVHDFLISLVCVLPMCVVFYCFILVLLVLLGEVITIKRFEYPCLTPTVVTSSQLQYFSILQLIEHYDVKIFLILPLFDSIAATFLSDPDPKQDHQIVPSITNQA